jgi:hypothetical protein
MKILADSSAQANFNKNLFVLSFKLINDHFSLVIKLGFGDWND